MSKILIVDDDRNICDIIRLYLEKDGFSVVMAHDGVEGLHLFREQSPALVILDIMLPQMDGLSVCREIKKISDIPIIMLTAKGETFDKILGLELGANDYVVKPFEAKELVARVKVVLRRYDHNKPSSERELVFPNLHINLSQYTLKVNGKSVDIPPKELELLYYLASNPNRVYTRDQLLEAVWGFDYFGDSRTVDVHINRLREKLVLDDQKWQLKTVWGVGYKFEVK
ncbi:MAG: response regulator transcription factor [Hyphomonadaceae bacterium]|nr:response regulator transcription factor [Clostridia bacterium]